MPDRKMEVPSLVLWINRYLTLEYCVERGIITIEEYREKLSKELGITRKMTTTSIA